MIWIPSPYNLLNLPPLIGQKFSGNVFVRTSNVNPILNLYRWGSNSYMSPTLCPFAISVTVHRKSDNAVWLNSGTFTYQPAKIVNGEGSFEIGSTWYIFKSNISGIDYVLKYNRNVASGLNYHIINEFTYMEQDTAKYGGSFYFNLPLSAYLQNKKITLDFNVEFKVER